ncbi:hypothetical protein LEP1GSC073_4099 [Leptospira noguchii str. Cascata]|nr:hypothetical protein LEP1GSC073_4099 [Leptospira noguchii str. Cascata]
MGTITNLNFTVQFSKFGKDYKPSVEFSSKKNYTFRINASLQNS